MRGIDLFKAVLLTQEEGCPVCETQRGVKGSGKKEWMDFFCPDCVERYFHPTLPRCVHCGKLLAEKDRIECRDCREGRGPKGLTKVTALGGYEGQWKETIWKIKFQAQPYLIGRLGRPLCLWAIRELPPADGVVPVPLHPQRLAERGFNQAEALASYLHWELGLPLLSALRRTVATPSQVPLSRQERIENLKGAFAPVGRNLQGKIIWLVDDVTTTGTTLESCAEAMLNFGAERVYGLCLAAGVERTGCD